MVFWASSEGVAGFVHQSYLGHPCGAILNPVGIPACLFSTPPSLVSIHNLAFCHETTSTDAMKYRCINTAFFRLFYS